MIPFETRSVALSLILGLSLAGCGDQGSGDRTTVEMPVLPGDGLTAGRGVWLGTCRACHLLGVAGAPAVTDFAEWDRRLPKGREALYQSALNGIKGDDGKYRMPPRGGNERLSEDQVRLAVDYKVAAIEALRKQAK